MTTGTTYLSNSPSGTDFRASLVKEGQSLEQVDASATLARKVGLLERFHQHPSQGKDSDSFNRQAHQAPAVEVAPAAQPNQEITPRQLTTLATALLAQRPPSPETDPLQRSRRLGAAAEGLVLTSKELSAVLGHGVSSWRNGREDYGFRFKRHKQQDKVLWSVERSFLLPEMSIEKSVRTRLVVDRRQRGHPGAGVVSWIKPALSSLALINGQRMPVS